ncbi:hypothetical protein Aduo_012021 [Ancylostoma duodenale]
MPSFQEINRCWLVIMTVFFIVVGCFGNLNIIWCTIRKKELRSKSGLLLAITSTYQFVCLLSTTINLTVMLFHVKINRSLCYPIILPYLICSCHQAPMILANALDLLFVLTSPIRYRTMRTRLYVAVMCIPSWLYAMFFAVCGWIMMNDDVLEFCNPVVAQHPAVLKWYVITNDAINVCILIMYMIIFVVLKLKGAHSEHRGVVRRLSVIVLVFVFSWFFAA